MKPDILSKENRRARIKTCTCQIQPTEKKIKDVKEMSLPENKKQFQSFPYVNLNIKLCFIIMQIIICLIIVQTTICLIIMQILYSYSYLHNDQTDGDIMYAHILDIFLIPTLISTPNVPICKFKYQIMFDHYGDHHLFDHCADHHLSDHYANIIQLFLFVILKYVGYQKKC